MTDILAKDLLLAAGWKRFHYYMVTERYCSNKNKTSTVDIYTEQVVDDNLCDMLIRELSEEQMDFFEDILSGVVDSISKDCTYGASLLRATAQQKAMALMETYKERE